MREVRPSVVYLTREDWGADPSLVRLGGIGDPRGRRAIGREERALIAVHHTVTIDNDGSPNLWETLDEIKPKQRRLQIIRPDLGLDVPYNHCIYLMPGGHIVVCEGRGFDRSGAHTLRQDDLIYNIIAMGEAFVGNFEDIARTNVGPWVPAINHWFGYLRHEQRMTNLSRIEGHRTLNPASNTACPGRKLLDVIMAFKFRLPATPTLPEEEEDMGSDLVILKPDDGAPARYLSNWLRKRKLTGQDELDFYRFIQVPEVKVSVERIAEIPDK